jgi:carbon monoxide dehydrogenase subunit G
VRATFSFRDSWEIAAPPAAVHGVLLDLERYPAWWPQVVAVASLGENDARVLCRSVLPYTLDLVLHAVSRSIERLEVGVSGDLTGSVCFTLTPVAAGTRLDFTQDVSVRGWLGAAAYLAGPLLRWNHDRMMRGCRRGLGARIA